ncbi:MAG: site-2 protease family protein [Eubacteriales bacterium]
MRAIFDSISNNIIDIFYTLPALLITITLHELAHGYIAYKLGDPTAKDMGRLTFNPIKHIDPMGFLTLLILQFGWAKPVPVNPNYFKNRRQGTFLVSLAGPLTNFILAFFALSVMSIFSLESNFLWSLCIYNVIFGIFNLLPIPPLDGSKLLASVLPEQLEVFFWKYEKYGYVILLILIFTNIINYILNPAIVLILNSMMTSLQMIINLFS